MILFLIGLTTGDNFSTTSPSPKLEEKSKEAVNEISTTTQPVVTPPDISEDINQKIVSSIDTQKLNRECVQDRVCVKPGDYLQYSYQSPQVNDGKGNLTYYFKDYLDSDNISVQLVSISEDGNKYEETRVMNLITGLLDMKPKELGASHNRVPHAIFSISPTQLTYEDLEDVTITEKKFGAWHGKGERDTIFVKSNIYGTDWSVDVYIDKETRVIIFVSHYTFGGYLMVHYVLEDTNIFN
ncbi:MAG TPA: hypothetical protein VD731_06435 [Nitrosopumilaceae archaeon]|nr:hypothetical protein [Nitrosopumilaceae archaeon]